MAVGEWPDRLDVTALLEQGWRPTAFREFVLKVHSRCNLSCDYCYVYTMSDQSWRGQPKVMAPATVDAVARRIAEHAAAHALDEVTVTLHGGEPLLAGHAALRRSLRTIQEAAGAVTTVRFAVQTNGVLLDGPILDLFAEYGVGVGVSLDGDREGHDRHRLRADGRGSHAEVAAGLRLLTRDHPDLFGGLLCAIDLDNDPVTTYEALAAWGPPGIDLLLPHGTWDAPPPGLDPAAGTTPYADWLITVFDHWYGSRNPQPRIRLFTEIVRLLFGRGSVSEAVGLSPIAVAVVETSGSIEQVDTLKTAFAGAAATPLHVARDPFDAALLLPSIAARQIGASALCDQCLGCEAREVCGGGLYPHRYRSGTGFRNPSVYCGDLLKLIRHIRDSVSADLDVPVSAGSP